MLYTIRRRAEVQLSREDLAAVIGALPAEAWRAALRGQQRFLLELAGVDDKVSPDAILVPDAYRRRTPSSAVEIFFRDEVVIFLLNGPVDISMGDKFVPTSMYPGIEIGGVGASVPFVEAGLDKFAADLEAAVRAALDGRRTRHMEFKWRRAEVSRARLDELCRDAAEEGPAFRRANLDESAVKGAFVLAEEKNRQLVRLIAEASFLRETELLEGRGKRIEDAKRALATLRSEGLLVVEYLLQCRKTSSPLGRFGTRNEIEKPEFTSVRCPTCGAPFASELATEGYSLSQLGRSLVEQSHWMTVWVTKLLTELGIPVENIVWNVSEAGEEVDIIAEVLNQLWIFEIKDRDFGSGDAHPFNYRQVRFGAQRAIIVTTGTVQKDAKKVFDDLARESRAARRASVVYVEGLGTAREILSAEIERASINYARWQFGPPGEGIPFDLGPILAAKFADKVDLGDGVA